MKRTSQTLSIPRSQFCSNNLDFTSLTLCLFQNPTETSAFHATHIAGLRCRFMSGCLPCYPVSFFIYCWFPPPHSVFIIFILFLFGYFLKKISIRIPEAVLVLHFGEPQTRKSLLACVDTASRAVYASRSVQGFYSVMNPVVSEHRLQGITKHLLQQLQGFVVEGKSGVSSEVQFLQFWRQVFR